MRDNYSQERKDFIRYLNKGKNLPEDVIEKHREAAYKRSNMPLNDKKNVVWLVVKR